MKRALAIIFIYSLLPIVVQAQEHLAPLQYNAALCKGPIRHATAQKTTSLALPFFEDFTNYGGFPDPAKWTDDEAYINNTMCLHPISRGCATLDALNQFGIPYDTLDNNSSQYSDSLTSQPIDLGGLQPADSVYLSFFYQPGGNGFAPTAPDSLLLYMRKNYNDWSLVWSSPGGPVQGFQQVMVAITDTNFLYDGFQFRFVNIAGLNYSDADWNIDYIRLNANRHYYDTSISDVAFTTDPSFYLNDYTAMPYRQFLANPNSERANQYTDSIRNNNFGSQPISYGFTATDLSTGTVLSNGALSTAILGPEQTMQLTYPSYTSTPPMQGYYDAKTFQNKYFVQSVSTQDQRANDTIVRDNVFDNYLAYDDGSAEQSYYLTQAASSALPAYLAVEYHLNQPDTLQGVAVYFGRQAPPPSYKQFSLVVFKTLAGVNGDTDQILYEQDNNTPGYDTINHFWTFRFAQPVPLPAGLFYLGTIQQAYSGADSLYFGYDVNRIGNNHVYFNVQQQWTISQFSGAVMIRPLLGQAVTGTGIKNVNRQPEWRLLPNPAHDEVFVDFDSNKPAVYKLIDVAGRQVLRGTVSNGDAIDISMLSAGVYFVSLQIDGVPATPQKIIKD